MFFSIYIISVNQEQRQTANSKMSSPSRTTYEHEPDTPRTPKATRHSRSRDAELLKAPKKSKPTAASFKNLSLELSSPPPSTSTSTADNVTTPTPPPTNLTTVRTNSREFRRSVSPEPVEQQPVAVAKPRERQAAHWVKFNNVSIGRARTAKMNHNEWAEVAEE